MKLTYNIDEIHSDFKKRLLKKLPLDFKEDNLVITYENRVFYKDLPHIEYIGCGLCICYDIEQDENGEEIIKNMPVKRLEKCDDLPEQIILNTALCPECNNVIRRKI
jgi:hypothetical protein